MTTTTEKMTCQICGKNHKTRTDKKTGKVEMVHHGYKLPYTGAKTASCKGTNEAPYEHSCEYIKIYIRQIRNDVSYFQNQIDELIANPPASMKVEKMHSSWDRFGRIEYNTYEMPEGFAFDPKRDSGCFSHKTYEYGFYSQIANFKQAIKEMNAYTVTLQMRVNNWKAAE